MCEQHKMNGPQLIITWALVLIGIFQILKWIGVPEM